MKLGIALSGGGVPGIAAHIGFMETLLSQGITPDIVVGTSAGGIVAGSLAAGLTIEQIAASWSAIGRDPWKLIPHEVFHFLEFLRPRPTPGLLDLSSVLRTVLPPTIQQAPVSLWKPGYGVAVSNLSKVEPVLLCSDDQKAWRTVDALTATAAVPVLFSGIRDVLGDLYCDGGLFDMAPVNFCRKLGADKVVEVVIGKEYHIPAVLSAEQLLDSTVNGGLAYTQRTTNPQPADLGIEITVRGSLLDFTDFHNDISEGDTEALTHLDAIRALVVDHP